MWVGLIGAYPENIKEAQEWDSCFLKPVHSDNVKGLSLLQNSDVCNPERSEGSYLVRNIRFFAALRMTRKGKISFARAALFS